MLPSSPAAAPIPVSLRPLRLATEPRLFVIDGFATDAEIDHLAGLHDDLAGVRARDIAVKADATGTAFEWPVEGDPVAMAVAARMQSTFRMDGPSLPTLRCRRYLPGEGHPPHLDNFRIGDAFLLLTALLYLDDTDEGGETVFPNAHPGPVIVAPRRGRLLAWFSHRPNGAVDERSLHEGRAVVRGAKTTATAFVYRPIHHAARLVPSDAHPLLERAGHDGSTALRI